jgi:hypothetical protein
MLDQYIVARLTAKASQVLLCLLLTREREVTYRSSEFATYTGLERHSVSLALRELEEYGLITIIPGSPTVVKMEIDIGYDMVVPSQPTPVEFFESETQDTQVREVEVPSVAVDLDPLDACQAADASGSRAAKKAALKRVWGVAFPVSEYEYSQLSDSFASWLTKDGRSSEDMGTTILHVGESWRGRHLDSPVGYIRAAVEGEEKRAKRLDEQETVIDDYLRELARIGNDRHA